MDGGHVVDSENWVFSGIAMRGCHLKPVLTKVPLEVKEGEGEGEGEGDHGSNYTATTPTSSESRISKILICPPAPKKRKSTSSSSSSSSKLCHYGRVREFFNPPDLEAVFVRRVEGA